MTTAKPASPDPVRWLSTTQAAEISHESVWTVQRWIREGLLPAYRVGRPYLINPADLDEFLASHPHRPMKDDPLAEQIRRVLAGDGDFPEPTDDQIRLIARLLPRPEAGSGAA